MKTTISVAALVLGGLVFIGCDKKDTTTVSTPDGTTTVTTPSGQSMADKAKDAANNAGDAIKTDAAKMKDAASDAADKAKAEASKLGATTMPSMPSMGK